MIQGAYDKMVPQQALETASNMQHTELIIKDELVEEDNSTVFGSQMVAVDSNTPYSDATQVRHLLYQFII